MPRLTLPVPVGESVKAVVTVQDILHKSDKTVYLLQTECFLPDGRRAIQGEALLLRIANKR